MDANKLGSWANIGSFVIGCFLLYFAWSGYRTAAVAPQGISAPALHAIPTVFWVFLSGMVLAGCLHVAAAVIQARFRTLGSTVVSSHASPRPSKPSLGRVFVGPDITGRYLTGLFVNHTDIEARRLLAPYLESWMKVAGTVDNVRESSDEMHVVLTTTEDGPVFLTFDKKAWKDHLLILRKGNKLGVIGKIVARTDRLGLSLDKCELDFTG